jgi:hypothetical protein
MKKIIIYTFSLSLMFTTSCKQINKWFKKSSLNDEDVVTLIMEKQELERRIKADSANYERELEALRMEYEQKLAQFEKTNKKSATGFFVIVGSFKNIGLAEKYTEKIKSMGYEATLISGPNNFHCVSTGNYPNLKQSLPALSKARSAIIPEAWIFIK